MQINEVALTKLVLKSEGGYCNDAGDPGGPTNFGITIADVRKYVKPGATAADVRALTLAQAIEVYDKHYWDAMSCDDWPSGLDYVVYDYGINSGIGRPPRVLQAIMGLPQTSRIDAALIAKAKATDAHKLIDAVCDERLHFMRQIRGGDAWARFGKGWATRVASVRKTAHLLAQAKAASPEIVAQHPANDAATPKATHIDPKLGTKIATGTTISTGATAGVTHLAQPSVLVTLAIAGVVLIVIAGTGYLIYRNQQKRQLAVELPWPPVTQ